MGWSPQIQLAKPIPHVVAQELLPFAINNLSLLEGRTGSHGGVVLLPEKVGGGGGSDNEGEGEEIHCCV